MNYNSSDSPITRVTQGNEFTLSVKLQRPYAESGKLTYKEYDLSTATDIAVAIYPTVGSPISLEEFTVSGSTINVNFPATIAAGLYGLEVKGKDSLGKDWRWYAGPGEIIEIVEKSSDAYAPTDTITASVGVVGAPETSLAEIKTYADKAEAAADTVSGMQTNIDAEAAARAAADTEIMSRLTGTSTSSNALTDPFIYLGNFVDGTTTKEAQLQAKLDAVYTQTGQTQYAGLMRARIDGANISVTQYAIWNGQEYCIQVASGPITLNDDGQITQGTTFAEYSRTHKKTTGWTNWTLCGGATLADELKNNQVKMVALTQSEYDAKVAAGTVDANTYYNILEE